MDLRAQNPSLARFRAIGQIGKHDAAYTAADEAHREALDALPHRHSGIDPTPEQSTRAIATADWRSAEWNRIAAIFDAELGDSRNPKVMGEIADRIIERMKAEQ